jgi:hypothetical protein
MIADALYIYVSPVVLVARVTWIIVKKCGKALAEVSPALAELFRKKEIQNASKQENAGTEKKAVEPIPLLPQGNLARYCAPLLHFSACWCCLVGISNERWLLAISLAALLCIAATTIAGVHAALNDASRLMGKMGEKLRLIVENITKEVTHAAPDSKEFQQSAQNVRIYGALLRYLASTEAVQNVTRRFTLGIAIPTYIYTSLVCGFMYFDIAKLQALNWPLGEALTDSLFMPIAWTELPHSYAIRLLAGIQVGCLILIGYDAIFRSINDSVSRLATAAHGLSSMIEADNVSAAMRSFDPQKTLTLPVSAAPGEK